MISLPVQFARHSGPNAIGDHSLVFTIDESIDMGAFNPTRIKRGTQFMMVLIESDKEDMPKQSETPEETKSRFQKRMYALMNELAELSGKDKREIKELLKKFLIEKGKIKESTTELDIEGYAFAIYYIQSKINNLNES